MVGHAGSPTRRPTMHVDMTLTGSKFKVKVIHLLNFRKLHFSTSTSSTICVFCSQLMGDYDSMAFRARFLNSSPVGGHVTSKFSKY